MLRVHGFHMKDSGLVTLPATSGMDVFVSTMKKRKGSSTAKSCVSSHGSMKEYGKLISEI